MKTASCGDTRENTPNRGNVADYPEILDESAHRALCAARFCAMPEALRAHVADMDIGCAAELLYRDLYAIAIRQRTGGGLALQWPADELAAHLRLSESSLRRSLARLEAHGLLVRYTTRHPANPYRQGWTIIEVRIPEAAWAAIEADAYRKAPGRKTRKATANAAPADATAPDRRPAPPARAEPKSAPESTQAPRDTSANAVEATYESPHAPAAATASDATTDTEASATPTATDIRRLWKRSADAATYLITGPGFRQRLCERIAASGSPLDDPAQLAVVIDQARRDIGSEAMPEVDPNRLANELSKAHNARQADEKQAAARRLTLSAETVAAIDRLIPAWAADQVAWSLARGGFRCHWDEPLRAIHAARRVIGERRWGVPFGYNAESVQRDTDGGMTIDAPAG